ncbi:hypothetical protein CRG98_034884 [Punica granatum]|uniref:Uncharacterized protein n=1 Tax=Punica granatum TaxID=22663 RepID=A0A2I0IL33_PUNGR|nr:hypothetical protein CRG98_034884 [Punica granatum]
MTSFEALYGFPSHLTGDVYIVIRVEGVGNVLKERQAMMGILKENLTKAQERMKIFADQRHIERTFEVGDWVFLKLQPYRQTTLSLGRNLKLTTKYYGPYEVVKNKKIRKRHTPTTTPPMTDEDGSFEVQLIGIVNQRSIKLRNRKIYQVFIQCRTSNKRKQLGMTGLSFKNNFPTFVLEDKDFVKAGQSW